MYEWQVVPFCEKQLRDINVKDILCDGLYRRCDIYKGGGGYDKFEAIYNRRCNGHEKLNEQFVVQLRGCVFKCPYCYVTRDGVFGKPVLVDTAQMVASFRSFNLPVFHLMGGAPALYLEHWSEILSLLPESAVFHSDFLLQESEYSVEICKEIARFPRQLHAVSIKGADEQEYFEKTGVKVDMGLLWRNLGVLRSTGVPFYITYTGMSAVSIEKFNTQVIKRFDGSILADAFNIDIIHYKALD